MYYRVPKAQNIINTLFPIQFMIIFNQKSQNINLFIQKVQNGVNYTMGLHYTSEIVKIINREFFEDGFKKSKTINKFRLKGR